MADLASLAAAFARRGSASFQHGYGLGAPRCTDDGWLGVGVTDLAGRGTRVVQVSVPRQTRRRWETMRGGNPIDRAGNAIVRRAIRRWGGVPQEWRFDGAAMAMRRGPDEQVVLAGDEPVRLATLARKASETGEPFWRVLTFTGLGIGPEAVDLWDAWARLSPQG
ncbi:MAG TPA: hypothetical protein VI111_06540 [Thermoleophilaceae bacterium]